jgi:hypothetical protein
VRIACIDILLVICAKPMQRWLLDLLGFISLEGQNVGLAWSQDEDLQKIMRIFLVNLKLSIERIRLRVEIWLNVFVLLLGFFFKIRVTLGNFLKIQLFLSLLSK